MNPTWCQQTPLLSFSPSPIYHVPKQFFETPQPRKNRQSHRIAITPSLSPNKTTTRTPITRTKVFFTQNSQSSCLFDAKVFSYRDRNTQECVRISERTKLQLQAVRSRTRKGKGAGYGQSGRGCALALEEDAAQKPCPPVWKGEKSGRTRRRRRARRRDREMEKNVDQARRKNNCKYI